MLCGSSLWSEDFVNFVFIYLFLLFNIYFVFYVLIVRFYGHKMSLESKHSDIDVQIVERLTRRRFFLSGSACAVYSPLLEVCGGRGLLMHL